MNLLMEVSHGELPWLAMFGGHYFKEIGDIKYFKGFPGILYAT